MTPIKENKQSKAKTQYTLQCMRVAFFFVRSKCTEELSQLGVRWSQNGVRVELVEKSDRKKKYVPR